MVTIRQLPNIIRIVSVLRRGEISIAELSRQLQMSRSTLIYYLNILEKDNMITRERMQEKKTGRPTIIKFNDQRYAEKQKELIKKQQEEEKKILNDNLTYTLLKVINKNSNPTLKDIHKNIPNGYAIGFRLNWLIEQGLVVNEFKLTSEGKKFLKENSK